MHNVVFVVTKKVRNQTTHCFPTSPI